MRNRADLESIHRFSSKNRELLSQSNNASCFHCLASFAAGEVQDWVDGPRHEAGDLDNGVTALCPRCGIDAVLPSAAPVKYDAGVLAEMNQHFFGDG